MADESESKRPYTRIMAFIDWNSQLLIYNGRGSSEPLALANQAFKMITRKISTSLSKLFPEKKFKITLRFYHGWHKGYEPTVNKKAIITVIADTDFATLSHKPSVIFSPEVGYGDCLLSALPERLNKKLQIHLPNTLRDRGSSKGQEEKMVDTALAADLIVTAFQEPDDWILVVSEDDDFVPPLFVAESIIRRQSSRALLLSSRTRKKNMLNLENISVN